MADAPAPLDALRRLADHSQLQDWQIFPRLADRLNLGEIQAADLLAPLTALVIEQTDRNLRRWALGLLPVVAERAPETADAALAPMFDLLEGETDWCRALPAVDHSLLREVAVIGLGELAERLPGVIQPHRERLLAVLESSRSRHDGHAVQRVFDGLRRGQLTALRKAAVRSTPKLFDTAQDGACFVILDKDRYHTAHCRHLRRQVRVRVVPLASAGEAERHGFVACGHCHRIGADGSATAKPKPVADTTAQLGPLPAPAELRLVPPAVVEAPWTPPAPRPGFEPHRVPLPSVYERLTMLAPDQQRLVGLWLDGDWPQASDVYRAIFARHHASLLHGPHRAMAAAALEQAVTGLPTDSWCASQLSLIALIGAYLTRDPVRFGRLMGQRPETVFEFPFLLHLHGDLGARMTPELLFGLRKLSGTRSSAGLKRQWARFTERAQGHLDAFVAQHDGDPIHYALRAGKGRKRHVSFGFGRDCRGDVRFVDVLHGLPLATVTGDLLTTTLADLRGPARSGRQQREQAQRAALESLHAERADGAKAALGLIAGLQATPATVRPLAAQGLQAFEAGDMVKAAAYLHKALEVDPQLPTVFQRAYAKAAGTIGLVPAPAAGGPNLSG